MGNYYSGEFEQGRGIDERPRGVKTKSVIRNPGLTKKKIRVVIDDNPFYRDKTLNKTVIYENTDNSPAISPRLYEPPLRRRMVECSVLNYERRKKAADICREQGILYGRASRFKPANPPCLFYNDSSLQRGPDFILIGGESGSRYGSSSTDSFPEEITRHPLPDGGPSKSSADASRRISVSNEEFIEFVNRDGKIGKRKITRVPSMRKRTNELSTSNSDSKSSRPRKFREEERLSVKVETSGDETKSRHSIKEPGSPRSSSAKMETGGNKSKEESGSLKAESSSSKSIFARLGDDRPKESPTKQLIGPRSRVLLNQPSGKRLGSEMAASEPLPRSFEPQTRLRIINNGKRGEPESKVTSLSL